MGCDVVYGYLDTLWAGWRDGVYGAVGIGLGWVGWLVSLHMHGCLICFVKLLIYASYVSLIGRTMAEEIPP